MPLPATEATALDEKVDTDKPRIAEAQWSGNGVAMANFVMAFKSEATMGMILECRASSSGGGISGACHGCSTRKLRVTSPPSGG